MIFTFLPGSHETVAHESVVVLVQALGLLDDLLHSFKNRR